MTRHTMLLEGPAGTGKTTSLRSACAHVDRMFVLCTEPGLQIVSNKSVPGMPKMDWDKVHYKYLPTATPTWRELRENAMKINSMTIESLQKTPGMQKLAYDQFIQMYDIMSNFRCDCHPGSEWGPVDSWDDRTLFALDGLTGISTMSMDLTVGGKPVKTQPEWGVAMDNLERFVAKCVYDTRCSFVLLGHVGRERDEVTGGVFVTTHTLGVKLAPKLVQMFDEVVLAKKSSGGFLWSTNEPNADLKNRYLPSSDKIPPDFGLLLKE